MSNRIKKQQTPTITMAQQYRYNLKQVLFLTKMNEEELNFFMSETAYTWLYRYARHTVDIDDTVNSLEFRSWWRMHWMDRDDRYFISVLYGIVEEFRYSKYRMMHQCVFNMTAPTTDLMYKDFLDLFVK